MRRGEVWRIPASTTPRTVLVLSINEANDAYRVAIVLDLRDADAAPDTMLSVVLKQPVAASAFAMNLMQLNAARFDPAGGAARLGSVSDEDMARVWEAVRAVLGP
jgi:mRNA-degrading endonuclease toxin of MazEF toxin-antitoxin module